jgi:hypothetical protein
MDLTKIISTYDEAYDFATNNKLKDMFDCGEFTVMRGEKKVD